MESMYLVLEYNVCIELYVYSKLNALLDSHCYSALLSGLHNHIILVVSHSDFFVKRYLPNDM